MREGRQGRKRKGRREGTKGQGRMTMDRYIYGGLMEGERVRQRYSHRQVSMWTGGGVSDEEDEEMGRR